MSWLLLSPHFGHSLLFGHAVFIPCQRSAILPRLWYAILLATGNMHTHTRARARTHTHTHRLVFDALILPRGGISSVLRNASIASVDGISSVLRNASIGGILNTKWFPAFERGV